MFNINNQQKNASRLSRESGFTQHHFYDIILKSFSFFKFNNKLKDKFRLYNKSGAGFTMVEMIVVLVIMIMVTGFLAYLTISNYWIYNNQTAQLNISSDARNALDDVDNYVRQSHRVMSSYSTYTTGTKTVVLQIESIDASNQIIAGTYDTVVYYLSGSNFFRQVFPDPSSSRPAVTKKLASNVDNSSFSFSYDNADYSLVKQVTTNITVAQNVSGTTRTITISSESKLRNY